MANFVTDPTTFLEVSRWYHIGDLAALFGVANFTMEAILGPDRATGGNVLAWLSRMGGPGSHGYVDPAGLTADSVTAFRAKYPAVA